jgi:uncharacterized protein
MRVRDPIHGTISVEEAEVPLLDSRFFQRLRWVKQLGFGDLAFPGATHTRHAHSLGAMVLATRVFDQVFPPGGDLLTGSDRLRFRQSVRIASLCHDIGHMPLSHASEAIAPPRAKLALPSWLPGSGQASHEDFTAKILLDSELAAIVRGQGAGVTAEGVVALIAGTDPPGGSPFVTSRGDFGPVLRQIVSGELDADRMDYLQRDSFYTGVDYGHFDIDWIIQNLSAVVQGGRVFMALSNAAIFAFEDFLLSRFHMFVSVYYHHTSVGFDRMLRRFYEEAPGEFVIPAEPDAFAACDDVALAVSMRRSANGWAQRIVRRDGYKLLVQVTALDKGYDLPALARELAEAGIEHFATTSEGVLSKYFGEGGPPLYVFDRTSGRLTPVAEYTPLYQRYAEALRISRVYCRPDQRDAALAILRRLVGGPQNRPG